MHLVRGLDERKLEKRIATTNRIANVGERALGFYLLDFHVRGLCRKKGYSSTAHYALMKHGIRKRRTRELIRISRALEELPLIDAAFARGELLWSVVRELTRVATAETEREWLDAATASNLKEIERLVSRASRGERPPKDPYGLTKTRVKVIGEFALEDHAVVQAAIDLESATKGEALDMSTAILALAKYRLENAGKERKAKNGIYQVAIHRCSDCDRAWYETGDGPVGVAAEKADRIEAEAEVIRLDEEPVHVSAVDGAATNGAAVDGAAVDGPVTGKERTDENHPDNHPENRSENDPHGSPSSTPETPHVPKEKRDTPNTPHLRQQILSRDGNRCTTPGCGNKLALMCHHVEWRAHGGRTEVVNEVAVCQTCHSLVHEGLLKVRGNAPHGLEWAGADGERLDRIDKDWWGKFGHNFEFRGNKLVLKRSGT